MIASARQGLFAIALALPAPALAAPGLGDDVYPAELERGQPEAAISYHSLAGGTDDGESSLQFEGGWSPSDSLRLGVQVEFGQEPGLVREFEGIAIEASYELGRIGPVSIAAYGAYAITPDGPDSVIARLMLQHRSGPVDLRFNLNAEKTLRSVDKLELGYGIQADAEVADELRLGVQAFGELGTFDRFLPDAGHFAGPVASLGFGDSGPALELQAAYLFALGTARQDTEGQFRMSLALEF